MPRFFRKSIISHQMLRKRMLCPHCGNDDFIAIGSKLSWLLGQKFICKKCRGTFRKARLVAAPESRHKSSIKQIGHKHRMR